MKTYPKFLIIIVAILLSWGINDFVCYYKYGIDTITQFLRTGAESTIKEMVYGNLRNGVVKTLLAILTFVMPLIKTKRKKTDK